MPDLLKTLSTGRVLLMDGAQGTELLRAGLRSGECHELWNLTHPERVRAVHEAYLAAGAEVLVTNTFQANPPALARHGLEGKLPEIIQTGIALAREAAGPERFVLLSVGPLPAETDPTLLEPILAAADGVDGVLLETWSGAGIDAGRWASSFLKKRKGPPVLLSLTYVQETPGAVPHLFDNGQLKPEEVGRQLSQDHCAILGCNCGRDIGLGALLDIIERYRLSHRPPFLARPNAGTPDAGLRYSLTPEMFAARLPELLALGVQMIGGCCGTTPAHIAALWPVVDAWNRKMGGSIK